MQSYGQLLGGQAAVAEYNQQSGVAGLGASTRPTLHQIADTSGAINKQLTEIVTRTCRLADALSLSAEVSGLNSKGVDAPEPSGFVDQITNRQGYTNQHLYALTEQLIRIERALGVGG